MKLEQNYRSTKTIVTAASHVIRNNTQRKDKTLFTENISGDKIIVREEPNEYEEARFVARSIVKLHDEAKHGHRDFAVFYRTNAQSRVLEEQLRMNSIRIASSAASNSTTAWRSKIFWIFTPCFKSDGRRFRSAYHQHTRARIGKTTTEKLQEYAYRQNLSLLAAIPEACMASTFNTGTARKLLAFHETIQDMRSAAKDFSPTQAFHEVLDKTGYVRHLREQDSTEAEARIDT